MLVFCSASKKETFSFSFSVHDLEDFLDDLRREPHRRLVEQDHLRLRHQRAADRGHLLLAARGVAGERGAPLLELREIGIDHLEIAA
jgi:hypothetical protein